MRIKLILFAFILINLSCTTRKGIIKRNTTCLFDNPIFKIEKGDLSFDSKRYDSILSKKGKHSVNTKKYIERIQSKKIWLTDRKNKLTKKIKYNNSNRIEQVYFYLKQSTSTKIGKEYFFNANSEITKTIDHEKGYSICWVEAIGILKKIERKTIKKHHIETFILNRVDLNEFPHAKPEWTIAMEGDIEGDYIYKRYVIDGATGKLIKTYTVNVIHETIN